MAAVRAALGMGAQVMLFDKNPDRLREADRMFDRRVITFLSYRYSLERVLKNADVVIGAVWVHGSKPPILITRDMMRQMKPGSVIVDCSIDQGGICETGRPTTLSNPTFVAENVVHCCIPNMPSAVARTSSFALANALFPYIRWYADGGLPAVIAAQPRFAEGLYLRDGKPVHPVLVDLADRSLRTPAP
jgi:alanine dehydrogenase